MGPPRYTPRLIDPILGELLEQLPAVLLVGPRATGKTTTARRQAATVVRLDVEAEAAAFRADPDAALRALPEPVLLDEWQVVPALLGAVKRAVDDDPRPGRFILTGSVTADLEASTWPGTGRVVRLALHGMSMREVARTIEGASFFDRLALADVDAFDLPGDRPDLRGYVQLALRGGFPDVVLRLEGPPRRAWLSSYVDQLLTRDAAAVSERDPARMRLYFEAVALNTAGLPTETTLYQAAGINARTAAAYWRLLTNLLVVEAVPAWSSNRLARLVKTAKRYVVDPALAAALLRLDEHAVVRDGDLLGRLLDTFVVAQLRPELATSGFMPRLYHIRQKEGRHEIDLVVEIDAGRVLAIEIKATASPDATTARHLRWLRDTLGDRFAGGAVLHTGPRAYRLDDRILALPICALWG